MNKKTVNSSLVQPLSNSVVSSQQSTAVLPAFHTQSTLLSATLNTHFLEHKKNHPVLVMIFFGLGMAIMFRLIHG